MTAKSQTDTFAQAEKVTADDLRAVYDAWCVDNRSDAKWMSPTAAMIRAILSRYDVVPKGAAQPPAAPVEAISLAEPPSALTADDRAQDLAHSRLSADNAQAILETYERDKALYYKQVADDWYVRGYVAGAEIKRQWAKAEWPDTQRLRWAVNMPLDKERNVIIGRDPSVGETVYLKLNGAELRDLQVVLDRLATGPQQSADSAAVPEREAFWLLEMVGHQKYALYTSQRNAFVHSWTEDVWQAGRFRDERDAHEAWRMLDKAERERWKPVEHMFINKVIPDEPQPVTPPPSDLASRAAELLTVPMGWGSGPALKALAEKIGGPYADVGAQNQTFREALEAVVHMGGGPQELPVTTPKGM